MGRDLVGLDSVVRDLKGVAAKTAPSQNFEKLKIQNVKAEKLKFHRSVYLFQQKRLRLKTLKRSKSKREKLRS